MQAISAHLPILQVVLPLLSAPLCTLLRRAGYAWTVSMVIAVAGFLISCALLLQVLEVGTISYELGGWAAPWGIEYRVDLANSFVLIIVSAINLLALPYSWTATQQEIEPDQGYLFYTGWQLCLTGLLGIAVTADAFNLFVFLEISSLSTYLLVSLGRDRRALTAAFRYLIMGTVGATFILIGVGLLYMLTGTLNMADLAQRLPELGNHRTLVVAFGFIVVGVGVKMALFPLHSWLPNAYAYAPSAVSVFLAGTATKVAVYVMLRFIFTVFGIELTLAQLPIMEILLGLGIAGSLVGSVIAVFQHDLKRLFAYSSVAQIGYMAIGAGLGTVSGLSATFLHLFNHAAMKAALFMALGCVIYRLGGGNLKHLRGAGKAMPWTMAAFVIAGLSLVGVPLTVGFVSKWYLVLAVIERQWWWLVVLILISSLVAMIYVWKIVEAAYFQHTEHAEVARNEAPLSLLIPTWILVIVNVYFGINATLTTDLATRAANTLIGGSP